MSEIIGADAAKLAGLQMDMLGKYRSQEFGLDTFAWWLGLSESDRRAVIQRESERFLAEKEVPVKKFALLVNLGVITVSEGHVNNLIFDGMNFSNPSRVLKPGDKLRVEACRQIVPGTTTSKERMAYLERYEGGNVYLGAQGIELVIAQKINQLPRGYWYASFDRKKNLPEDSGGYHRVPGVGVLSGGAWSHYFGCLKRDWDASDAFFRFSDFVESP